MLVTLDPRAVGRHYLTRTGRQGAGDACVDALRLVGSRGTAELFLASPLLVGPSVLGYDPYLARGAAQRWGVRLVDIDELVDYAEVLFVTVPPTPTAKHLLDRSGVMGATVPRPATSALVAALDTMGEEARFVRDLIAARGHAVLAIDTCVVGASSMERLPVETAGTHTVRQFKSIPLGRRSQS